MEFSSNKKVATCPYTGHGEVCGAVGVNVNEATALLHAQQKVQSSKIDHEEFENANKLPLAAAFHSTAGEKVVGVLITNLGSPSAPTYFSLYRYLRQFLSDRRVVDLARCLWLPILYGFILPFRSGASAEKYRRIWTEEGSPLVVTTRRQQEKLQDILSRRLGKDITVFVEFGMRYGSPSVADGLRVLRSRGVRRLVVIPLYPQPAEATVTSTYDAVFDELRRWRFMPELRMVSGYCDLPEYIEALATSVRRHWHEVDAKEEEEKPRRKLLVSYHGIPAYLLEAGDPYSCFCQKTTRQLREWLELEEEEVETVYQSRFGKAEWLQPYLDERLRQLAEEGVEVVDVISPGFATDCLETIDELEREYAELFVEAHNHKHGAALRYIRCLNDSQDGMRVIETVAVAQLEDWLGQKSKGNKMEEEDNGLKNKK